MGCIRRGNPICPILLRRHLRCSGSAKSCYHHRCAVNYHDWSSRGRKYRNSLSNHPRYHNHGIEDLHKHKHSGHYHNHGHSSSGCSDHGYRKRASPSNLGGTHSRNRACNHEPQLTCCNHSCYCRDWVLPNARHQLIYHSFHWRGIVIIYPYFVGPMVVTCGGRPQHHLLIQIDGFNFLGFSLSILIHTHRPFLAIKNIKK